MQNFFIFIDFIKKLYQNRYMIKTMAVRELRATYVGSLFGFLWALMNPLLQVVIYGVIFGIFFKTTPPPGYGTDSYVLYLISGLVPWQFFAQAVSSTPGVLIANKNLVTKAVGFPSEILPIVTVISNVISQLISLGLLVALLLIFAGRVSSFIFFIFVYLFFISVFTTGIGWILSSLAVFLRDIPQVTGLIMMALFFFTPIVYSPTMVPAKYLFILKLNPMYHMVEGYRLAMLSGRFLPAWDFLYLVLVSFFTLGAGGLLFKRLKPAFAEVL